MNAKQNKEFRTQPTTMLTKREQFAAMAMQGLCTQHETLLANNALIEKVGTIGIDRIQANKAVRLADALLAELAKEQE